MNATVTTPDIVDVISKICTALARLDATLAEIQTTLAAMQTESEKQTEALEQIQTYLR